MDSSPAAHWWAFTATVRKEWRILRRYPNTFVAAIVWPLVLPPFYLLEARGFGGDDAGALQAFAGRSGTADIAVFLYVGWAVSNWLDIVLWGPGTTLRDEQVCGSLEPVYSTPASRLSLLFGSTPGYMLVSVWQFLLVGLVLRFGFGVPLGAGNLLWAVLVITASVPCLFAIGGLFAVLVLRFRDASGLIQAARGLITICCGITYPIVVLPEWGRVLSRALPPTHILGALRTAMESVTRVGELARSVVALLGMGLIGMVVAVAVFRIADRQLRRSGNLGQF